MQNSDDEEKAERAVAAEQSVITDKIDELALKTAEIAVNAYREVSSLLGASIEEKTVADECKGYIKGRLLSFGEKGAAVANVAPSLKGVKADYIQTPVPLKLCMLADKRTGKGYEKDFLNAVTQISELLK